VHQFALADHHVRTDGIQPVLAAQTLALNRQDNHSPDPHHQLLTHLSESQDTNPAL
jgi:hypothetical protein